MISILKRLETPYEFSRTVRIKMFCLSVLVFILGGISSNIYRPYIYSHGIYDFHFADTCTNIFAVPLSFCLVCSLRKSVSVRIEVGMIAISVVLILNEIIGSTQDYYDMSATVISGILTTIVMRKIFPDWR